MSKWVSPHQPKVSNILKESHFLNEYLIGPISSNITVSLDLGSVSCPLKYIPSPFCDMLLFQTLKAIEILHGRESGIISVCRRDKELKYLVGTGTGTPSFLKVPKSCFFSPTISVAVYTSTTLAESRPDTHKHMHGWGESEGHARR